MVEDDDSRAFADATRDVTPLKSDDRIAPRRRRRAPRAKLRRAEELTAIEESMSGRWHEDANGEIEYRQHGVPMRTLRELRQGRFSVEAEIDLHGMTRIEAEAELKMFIAECINRRIRCVRVIHGKGSRSGPTGPVLKAAVHEWLARRGEILAFASARSRLGGSGAVCALLARARS